jgi:hypothetical protein
MIKYYWKNICRNLIQLKSNSSLNIFGLLLGITSCILVITNHKKVIFNFVLLIALFVFLYMSIGGQSSPLLAYPESNSLGIKSKSPIPIYYALNESHSNSWVQQSPKGVVGIVYGTFSQIAGIQGGSNTGKLIYKTLLPDGIEKEEVVTTDRGVDKCVLLFDSDSYPHIFFARSDNSHQEIFHLYKKEGKDWLKETVINFANEGGKFIYELSADIGKKDSIHLLALKTRSNPDSADFMDANLNSHLYYITNSSGNWEKTLIHRYNTLYTYDMHVKTQRRQDIAVDKDGHVHVVFGEQYQPDPRSVSNNAILNYATNKSSKWIREIALKPLRPTDDAGWYPSLCLDKSGRPVIASTYVARVQSRSVRYAQLCYSVRQDNGKWETQVVADKDDGYNGTDGKRYTGALPHLKIDSNNRPHIVFSDIASSHNPQNVLCTGQIRYAVFNGSSWDISIIYRQQPPKRFYKGKEMAGQCLVIPENGKKIQVIGQEMISTAKNVYTYKLLHFLVK